MSVPLPLIGRLVVARFLPDKKFCAAQTCPPSENSLFAGLVVWSKMKNPFDSRYSFWKRSDSHPKVAERTGSKPFSSPRHPTFPTKVIKDFIDAIAKKPDPIVLDVGSVIGSNIEYFLNFGIKIYMEDLLADRDEYKYGAGWTHAVVNKWIGVDIRAFT